MFDNEFYPTPIEVIKKMVEPFANKTINNKVILEPSAGKGDILDYISSTLRIYGANKSKVYAIERDPNLSYILHGKGYKVLCNDFLSYSPVHKLNLILMNPPFSNGDEHLLHAWEILDGGDIVCLLNAETILNPYSQRREQLRYIIDRYGSFEIIGDCFSRAERKTGVSVAMVRLHKDSKDNGFKINFSGSETKSPSPDFSSFASETNQVAINDKIGAYLECWENAQSACVEFIKARRKLEFYSSGFMRVSDIFKMIDEVSAQNRNAENQMELSYNSFLDHAKSNAWKEIIKQVGMDKFMTSSLRKSFDEFRNQQGAYDLTRENILNLIQMICMNSGNLMKKAVADVFDRFTSYYSGNRMNEEGWKTNCHYKVNRKIVIPYALDADRGRTYRLRWEKCDEYQDIDKVMCYLDGKKFEDMDTYKDELAYTPKYTQSGGKPLYIQDARLDELKNISLEKAIMGVEVGDSSLHESEYFTFRCYKKGTLHITFKDEGLWRKFNIAASDGKNMIG